MWLCLSLEAKNISDDSSFEIKLHILLLLEKQWNK